MRGIAFAGLLCLTSIASGVDTSSVSKNTFALVKVTSSAMTNTIISVPWTGYSEDESPLVKIRADRLVSPLNLTAGDMLMVMTNNASYLAWRLENAVGSVVGAKTWVPIDTVSLESDGSQIDGDNDGTAELVRGCGIWLIRQHPVTDDGKPRSFFLYGQYASVAATVKIVAGTESNPGFTMIANPDVHAPVAVNSLAWPADKIGSGDRLVLVTDSSTMRYCMWDAKKSQWYYTVSSITVIGGIPMATSTKCYDFSVPAGTGFWYVNRSGVEFELTFGPATTD